MKEAINIIDEEELDEEVYPIEVYAELTRKQYNLIQNDIVSLEVPNGVILNNKAGSRSLFFTCNNRRVAKDLEQGLVDSSITWQENYHEKIIN